MARPLRIEAVGAWYHITARGNERRAIFRDDDDRRQFLGLVGELEERFGVAVHAYVLLDNHYHLLLRPLAGNVSRAMQWLGVSYVVWFNRRHRRVGHLFQGRFKALLLEEEAAAEVSRYVHLNPIRVRRLGLGKERQSALAVGMGEASTPEQVKQRLTALREYRWSSYRAYVGQERVPVWLKCAELRMAVGGRNDPVAVQQAGYQDFVERVVREGVLPSPWARLEAQVLLGSAEFVARLRKMAGGNLKEQPALRHLRARPQWADIRAAIEQVRGESWEDFRDRHGDWGRDAALYLARQRAGLKLRELGDLAGGIDYRSVGSAVRGFKRRLARDRQLAEKIKEAETKLQNQEM